MYVDPTGTIKFELENDGFPSFELCEKLRKYDLYEDRYPEAEYKQWVESSVKDALSQMEESLNITVHNVYHKGAVIDRSWYAVIETSGGQLLKLVWNTFNRGFMRVGNYGSTILSVGDLS